MILWIDAQLSPTLAGWISETFGVAAHAVRDVGLREAKDVVIFHAAGAARAVVMSKDSDFVALLERFGPPPQVLWVTCGHTSSARMRAILLTRFPEARARLEQGESLVEISEAL
ncbi:MAG: DUF5615 family PIN-like protein [Methylococcales bacterium]